MSNEPQKHPDVAPNSKMEASGEGPTAETEAAPRKVAEGTISRAMSLLIARAHRLRFFTALLMASAIAFSGGVPNAAEPEVAVRAEGYLGYANLGESLDGFQGGGAGSLSLVFDPLYFQADLAGDSIDYDGSGEAATISPGVHLGWRDAERGSAGIVATYNHLDLGGDSLDAYRVGVEGEIYLEQVTLGVEGGYFDLDGGDLAYVDALVRVYPSERARLDFRGGAFGVDKGDPLVQFGAGGEFLVTDHLAPFVRWEGSFPDDFETSFQHSAVAGLTVYWGGDAPSIQAYDRTYFQTSCNAVLFLGRMC